MLCSCVLKLLCSYFLFTGTESSDSVDMLLCHLQPDEVVIMHTRNVCNFQVRDF